KRPGLFASVVFGVVLVGYVAVMILDVRGGGRLTTIEGLTKNTRADIWWWGFKKFLESPVVGVGWFSVDGVRWACVQSSYLQVLIEAGVIGILILGVVLLFIAVRWLENFARLRRIGASPEIAYLNLALLGPTLLHGLTESSLVTGTSLDP